MNSQISHLNKTPPTCWALVWFLCRMGPYVLIQVALTFEFLPTEGAWVLDGICGMFRIKVYREISVTRKCFVTSGKVQDIRFRFVVLWTIFMCRRKPWGKSKTRPQTSHGRLSRLPWMWEGRQLRFFRSLLHICEYLLFILKCSKILK